MDIIIVGAGKLGLRLAELFSQDQNNLTIIDISQERLENVSSYLDVLTILGNGVQLKILKQAQAGRAELFIAATSSDEVNVLACSLAKQLGSKRVIARIRNPDYGEQIDLFRDHFNIDYIANPELEMAKEIARNLLKGYSIHLETFAHGKVTMVEFRVNDLAVLADKSLSQLDLPKGLLIAAILRDNQTIIPHGRTKLLLGDVIYVIGKRESINEFSQVYNAPIQKTPVRNVMIIGGGRASYYLAQKLLMNHVQVKIIEKNEERCLYLAENLKGALIIHGDGTDRELLMEENAEEMDALISVTGMDEENLMIALLSQKIGVPKVIAKISRSNYIPILEQLGIDLAINPVNIIAGEVRRFAQGGNIVSLSLILQGEAEVLEAIVPDESRIVGKPLSKLNLPEGIIIGAIVREGSVIIPDGSSVIAPDDRIIVFCLQSEQTTLEKLLQGKRGFFYELWHNHKDSR